MRSAPSCSSATSVRRKCPAGFAAANVSALMQMQVHGVSTRKVAKAAEVLCGHGFSASTISRINVKLDADLRKLAERRLEGSFPYLILDARYEKVREDGIVRDRAVLIAVGIDAAGRRQVLGVDLTEGESRASWRRFLESLRDRGLCGVVQIVSDDQGRPFRLDESDPEGWSGSGPASISCGTPERIRTGVRATAASRSSAGSTIVRASRRRGRIWPRGCRNGRSRSRSFAIGSRRRSRRRSRSCGFPGSTISGCAR